MAALFLALGLLLGLAGEIVDRLMQSLTGLWQVLALRPALCQAVLGVGAFVVFLLLMDQSFAPQFVYMNF